MCVHKTLDANFRADFDLLGRNLGAVACVELPGLLDLTIPGIYRAVIVEHLKRGGTSVESVLADGNITVHFVLFADFKLKATAFQILVESLVCFHLNHPFFFLQS